MLLSEAEVKLGELMECDYVQYPKNVRLDHLRAAMDLIARYPETRLGEGMATISLLEGQGDVATLSITDAADELICDTVVDTVWLNPSSSNIPLLGGELPELLQEFGDTSGLPQAFSQHGSRLYFRPIPDSAVQARIMFLGRPTQISDESDNPWLRLIPWGVIFKAAESGCTYVGQPERSSEFVTQGMAHIEMFNVADASRNDTPSVSEEPG